MTLRHSEETIMGGQSGYKEISFEFMRQDGSLDLGVGGGTVRDKRQI